jgi:antitoxin (DNA-binding transcriptional repressor) of toxin-antitoxin stability system
MQTISLFDAKTHLSRIVESLVDGSQDQVIISRRGKAVVSLTAFRRADVSKRIGLAKGRFDIPENIDRANGKIASLLTGVRKRS